MPPTGLRWIGSRGLGLANSLNWRLSCGAIAKMVSNGAGATDPPERNARRAEDRLGGGKCFLARGLLLGCECCFQGDFVGRIIISTGLLTAARLLRAMEVCPACLLGCCAGLWEARVSAAGSAPILNSNRRRQALTLA